MDLSEYIKPCRIGDFEIDIFEISCKKDFRAIIDGIPEGRYVRLRHKGQVVMSNTLMEQRTNRYFCCNAHGDVLIGGLGIGMIIMDIQDKENVTSITVIEKNQEVIDLVASQLPLNDKVKIICADVFAWKPDKGVKYDCIYMDIWNYVNSEVFKNEMLPLKRKYCHYMKNKDESPKRFTKCWAEWHAKNNKRL